MKTSAPSTFADVPESVGLRTIGAVATFLSISRSKVYQMMDAGHLPYVKLGKSRRVRWGDVLKLIEQNVVGCEDRG